MTRPDRQYFTLALRSAVREAIWLASCDHEQGEKPNILLFASRRGGSTLAMELIGVNRGVRTLDQPFSTISRYVSSVQLAHIPRFHQGQITSVDPVTHDRLSEMVSQMFSGRAVVNAPTKFWRRGTTWRSDRLVLKITDAKPVIDWFDHQFAADIVYVSRHPIPQALSCLRNGWRLTVDAYLRDPVFVDRYLPDAAVPFAHDTMRGGTDLQRFILNWIVENVAPLRHLPDRPTWTHVRYEDCVVSPERTIELLAQRLDLSDVDRMQRVVSRPSASSKLSTEATRRQISAGHGAALVTRWREDVTPDDELWCNRALEIFEIDHRLLLP